MNTNHLIIGVAILALIIIVSGFYICSIANAEQYEEFENKFEYFDDSRAFDDSKIMVVIDKYHSVPNQEYKICR